MALMPRRGQYRRHGAKFKFQICEDIRTGRRSRSATLKEFNLSSSLIQLWLAKFDAGELRGDEDDEVEANHAKARIAALEREVAQLTLELDLLRPKGCRAGAIRSGDHSQLLTQKMTSNSANDIQNRLTKLGIELSTPIAPAAAFVPFVRSGDLIFVSGHIARLEGKPWTGQLGRDTTTNEGRIAARGIAIDLLATLQQAAGGLEHIARIVKVTVLVNSTPTYTEQHLVANGCSELFFEVLAESGTHARSAFGAAQLPMGACVEIEVVAQLL